MATCTSTTTIVYTLNLSKAEVEFVGLALGQYLDATTDERTNGVGEAVLDSIEEAIRESEDIDDVRE